MSELINISLLDKPDITHVQDNFNTLNNDKLEVGNINQGENIHITVDGKNITISSTGGGGTGQDGISLQYVWDGTSLGIKREDEINYTYVNLKGINGVDGKDIEMRYSDTYLQYRLVDDLEWINLVSLESLKNEVIVNSVNLDIAEIECPFKSKTYQLKGQMHCHTTTSDGALTPTQLLTNYKNVGYDFVSITDHDTFNLNVDVEGILHIRGTEFLNGLNHSHILGYDITQMRDLTETLPSNQGVIDFTRSKGALVAIAHPTLSFIKLMTEYSDLVNLEDYNMIEVYSYERKDDGDFIDILLSNGKRFNLIATDDYHNNTDTPLSSGWIMVNCDTKLKDDILSEIKNGNYYSSNGNDIAISKLNNVITATSTSASNFTFITDKGKTTVNNTTTATYALTGLEAYIRVVSTRVSDGKKAWSNPIFIKNIQNKQDNLNMVDMTQIYKNLPLTPFESPARNKLLFTNNFTEGSYQIIDKSKVLLNSGSIVGGTGCGLEYSIYDSSLCNKTLTFSGIIEKVSGTADIEVYVFASNGDEADVFCSSGRITKSKLFNLAVGQKQMFKIDFNIPYGYTGFALFVKQSTANNSFIVSDFSLTMYQRNISIKENKNYAQLNSDSTSLTSQVEDLETNQGDLTAVPTALQNKTIAEMITENFTSGSNWKNTIANTITAKGVNTLATDNLTTFANNILAIEGGEIINPKTFLYDLGNEYTELTGGWSNVGTFSQGNVAITKEIDHLKIYLTRPASSNAIGNIYAISKINLANYIRLFAEFTYSSTENNNINQSSMLRVQADKSLNVSPVEYSMFLTGRGETRIITGIDITNINGNYDVGLRELIGSLSSQTSATMKIYKVWLE